MTPAVELARLRQGLYRYFASTLAPPEQVRLEQLADAADYLEAMQLSDYAFDREWRVLMGVLESNRAATSLAPEHVRLFASGTKGVLCPPIESYYRADGRNHATPDIVTAIQRDYREMGLAASSRDAPDHVITQLEIMSTLCGLESAAWEAGSVSESRRLLEAQAEFLRRHLAGWLPQFRARVHAAAPHPFYAAVLDAVHSFVVHDQDLIAGVRRWSGAVA
jgi:TorA maturation chaperone TorD